MEVLQWIQHTSEVLEWPPPRRKKCDFANFASALATACSLLRRVPGTFISVKHGWRGCTNNRRLLLGRLFSDADIEAATIGLNIFFMLCMFMIMLNASTTHMAKCPHAVIKSIWNSRLRAWPRHLHTTCEQENLWCRSRSPAYKWLTMLSICQLETQGRVGYYWRWLKPPFSVASVEKTSAQLLSTSSLTSRAGLYDCDVPRFGSWNSR